MTTQALTSGVASAGAVSAAATASSPNGRRNPSERPPSAAAPARNERRSSLNDAVIASLRSSRPLARSCLGGSIDRLAHLLVGAAAADVGDCTVNIGVARIRLFGKQGGDSHDEPALAVTALRHVVVDPGLLHLV